MSKVSGLFEDCSKEPKAAGKVAILSKADRSLVDAILEDTFDGSRTYGVTSRNIVLAGTGDRTMDHDYPLVRSLLGRLATRELTGNAAIDSVVGLFSSFGKEDQGLLLRILDRNLAVGLTLESWTKATGRKHGKFEVPLAVHLEKAKGVDPTDGTYFASRKLDGVRLLVKADMDKRTVTFHSRSGKEYRTLGNLKEPILRALGGLTGTWALDGECCHLREDGTEDFQGIMKQVTRKDYTIPDPRYCVFDMVGWDVFGGDSRGPVFHDRYSQLLNLRKDKHIIVLEQERVTSQDIFDKWLKRVEDNDWEGFMLRKDTFFSKGRSKDLLKVKPYMDAEFVVKDIVAGKQVFAVPGKGNQEFEGVKDLVIEPWPGEFVHVGSGLTKEQRLDWLKEPGRIVGRTITVKYLEETVDQNGKRSLRHPTLKYVYENGRNGI